MIRAAEKAARSLVRDFGEVENLQVSQKGPGDFVSAADKRAEEIIFENLKRDRPNVGFMMEESGEVAAEGEDARWIIDPLDGTTNFLHGLPHWAISIALEEAGEIIAAIIYDPIKDDMFTAEKGQGAFLRRQRLRVSGRRDPMLSVIATGQPKRVHEKRDLFHKEYAGAQNEGFSLRRFGAASLDLAYVAAGRYEGFWERDLQIWDIAAGTLIVREAGGFLSDIDKDNNDVLQTGNIVAGNENVYISLKNMLRAL